jgi:hypothetical protein
VLQRKLTEVGPAKNPVQQFGIDAHSMEVWSRGDLSNNTEGLLVSREVGAGTPNGGSLWSVMHDWAASHGGSGALRDTGHQGAACD